MPNSNPEATRRRTGPVLLAATIFLGAFLLFQVQPIIGRYVLPWFGGGPMVWTTCMLFFEALLVAGYAYAHWLGSRCNPRAQSGIHIALLGLSLFCLPLDPRGILSAEASSSDPSGRILLALAISISGPYLLLSATGPLLQGWFHRLYPQRSPWRLYALSNAASFLALLSYPFAVEPYFTLRVQSWVWSALYVAFAIVCGWSAWRFRAALGAIPSSRERLAAPPGLLLILYWTALAAAGSILLLATTNLVCQDIAVIPFLWVAPLSIYLLTFVLVFESSRWYRRPLFAAAAGLFVPAGSVIPAAAAALPVRWQLAVYLAALFIACMICHGELARARPQPGHLTTFYLAIAGGGALGGAFAALLSPYLFSNFSEYPIGLAAACLLGFIGWARTGELAQWKRGNLAVRLPLMALLIGGVTPLVTVGMSGGSHVLARVRNFYGILRITERKDALNRSFRDLTHGRIRHGFQFLDYPQSTWPTTYYGPHSGIGIVLSSLPPPRRIGVIGLGAGTLAAWGRSGDTFRFYEINPAVVGVARDWFSYLRHSQARTDILLGDARVELERELAAGAPQFDVLAVDAFSSDAIPLHLLTVECADVYRRHLAPGGLLLLHVSNRVLDLDPVARGMARHLGWTALRFECQADLQTGESNSTWVLITANADFIARPEISQRVSPWRSNEREAITWTDDFASLWHVLRR